MALRLNLELDEVHRDWLETTAKDSRQAGLAIRLLLDLTKEDKFPAKPAKVGDHDPLGHYRKEIHQETTCKLSTNLLVYFLCNLDSLGDGIAVQTPKGEEPAKKKKDPKRVAKAVAKIEGATSSDTSSEVVPVPEEPTDTFDPDEEVQTALAKLGGAFSAAGDDSKYASSSAVLKKYQAHYRRTHSDDKDRDKIWDAAMMRIKLAVEHLVTHEKYGLRTITNEMAPRDDFGFLGFRVDARDDAYTRLTKLFILFPTLEIMINGLEYTIIRACEGDTNLKYVDIDELSRVGDLLRCAYAKNGGDNAARQSRRNVVSVAHHRSTFAYVAKESKEGRHTKDQLNLARDLYSTLINTDLIENLLMTESEVKAKVDAAMMHLVPKWEVGKPTRVKTDKKKKNVPNNTGLAYAAGATPAKMCDTCKTMGRGETVYTSHNTENHDPEKAKKFMAWKAGGKKKSAPADAAEKKNAN
jgi:hypothetical protein